MVSETKRYIPLFWMAFIPANQWDPDDDVTLELNRKDAIALAQKRLPFLNKVFADVKIFEPSATSLLERLSKLRCKSIGIDITELAIPEPPNPDLAVAIDTIEQQNETFSMALPARKEENPFTGETIEIAARNIASTKELLLAVSWLTQRKLDSASEQELAEYIVGYIWD